VFFTVCLLLSIGNMFLIGLLTISLAAERKNGSKFRGKGPQGFKLRFLLLSILFHVFVVAYRAILAVFSLSLAEKNWRQLLPGRTNPFNMVRAVYCVALYLVLGSFGVLSRMWLSAAATLGDKTLSNMSHSSITTMLLSVPLLLLIVIVVEMAFLHKLWLLGVLLFLTLLHTATISTYAIRLALQAARRQQQLSGSKDGPSASTAHVIGLPSPSGGGGGGGGGGGEPEMLKTWGRFKRSVRSLSTVAECSQEDSYSFAITTAGIPYDIGIAPSPQHHLVTPSASTSSSLDNKIFPSGGISAIPNASLTDNPTAPASQVSSSVPPPNNQEEEKKKNPVGVLSAMTAIAFRVSTTTVSASIALLVYALVPDNDPWTGTTRQLLLDVAVTLLALGNYLCLRIMNIETRKAVARMEGLIGLGRRQRPSSVYPQMVMIPSSPPKR